MTNSLDTTQGVEQQLTQEMAGGSRINALSDDPVAVGENVSLLNQIQRSDTFTQNATEVQGQLQVADSALGGVVSELMQAITLATSANAGTLSPSDVQSVSSQLAGVRDEVQSLANSNYQGQYIFAGGQSNTAPFSTDASTSPAITTYVGDSNVNFFETPGGQKIQLNVPGDQIFQSSNSDVFAALNSLIADYSTGTVNAAQAAGDIASLNTALNYVSQQRVTVDNSMNQMTAASNSSSNINMQLTSAQNNLMQADIASVATKLSTSETQYTALENMIASLESTNKSLFEKIS
jgi:flagellar hook-associated protein 3 FlgL